MAATKGAWGALFTVTGTAGELNCETLSHEVGSIFVAHQY